MDDDYYEKVQLGGIVTTIVLAALMVLIVAARDIFKVWDCFGTTESVVVKPDRQLTTMSAAYAPETMPGLVQEKPEFQNVQVPMGAYPMGMPPMPGTLPPMGMPGMPGMPMQSMPMPMYR